MRHSIKRISKSALSVILALMMVVSTMVVGIVTTSAATFNKWMIVGNFYNNWSTTDNPYVINSVQGKIEIDFSSISTKSLEFKLQAIMDDNSTVWQGSDQTNSLTEGTEYRLYWDNKDENSNTKDKDFKFSVTKRYVTFEVVSNGTYNYIKLTQSDTSSGSGETTTDLATSKNTLFVAYDKRTSNPWDKGHFWYNDGSGDIHNNVDLSSVIGITSLKYYDIDDDALTANKQINFIAHKSDWVNKYEITNATDFKKGVQWYAYNDGTNNSNAQYTPIAIKSLSTTEVTSGQDNTITFTPAGGVPYFLSDKGTSANYTLNVYEGSGTSGTKIVNNASIANAGTYDVTWNPSPTSDNQLTFELSDGIDSVSYTADFTVSAPVTSYKVLYGSNNSTYGSITATAGGSPIGSTVTAGTEVTFKATANDGFEVEGWYSNAGCTDKIADTLTANEYKVTVNSDTTVYVKFKEKTVTTGDWYISGWINKGEVKAPDDKYKFTETATSGEYSLTYAFTGDENGFQYITINDGTNVYHPTDYDAGSGTSAGSTTDTNFNTGNKWKVPATSDQSVTFTWNANTKTLLWTEATSKPVLATPTLTFSAQEIAESATSVTLTVSNHIAISENAPDVTYHLYKDGNLYKTFTGDTYEITEAGSYKVKAVPGTTSSNTYNESAFSTAQTITKAGNLAYKYYLIGDNGNVSYEMTPSETNPKILYSSISFNSNYWFKIKRVNLTDSNDVKYSQTTDNNFTLTPSISDKIITWGDDSATNSKNYIFNQSNVYYIKLDFTFSDTNPVISLSQTTDGKKSINVYTKDGTTVEGGTSPLGDTVLTDNSSGELNLLTENEKYNVYTANSGDYLTIQTTMTAIAAKNGYYVYAFCVNGISYPASAKANNVYETTYKVSGDEKNNLVEITPLYFNKNTENNNDYITVYVDASELGDHWGNTISCYSYYYTGGSNKEAYSTTGYPGQPMILSSNGLYYTRVPRIAYADGQPRTKSDGTNYTISGITLNSFIEKELHGTLYPEIGKNYQTYDYDDFKYIADLGYDTVKFEIKYRTGTSNQYTLLTNNYNHPTVSGTIDKTTYANNNGWDDLLNFDDEHVDILGNVISDYNAKGSHLYVVSTGNQDVADKGQWSTVWYVYDNDGKYITQGVPSDFIARPEGQSQTTQYTTINGNSSYKGIPVKITYESEMNADTSSAGKDGNSGVRIDGRWLYTKSTGQTVPVTVKVQYRDNESAAWSLDESETAGTVKIDDITSVNGVASKDFTERNVNAAITATSKSGYVFVGWGTVDDEGNNYSPLPVTSSSMDFLVDKSYNIVARFEKIQEGVLSITHEKYTGPDALGGGGYYLVSAVIKNSQGNEIQSFPETEAAINIALTPEMLSGKYTIDITLKTIMKGENTFVDYFRYDANDYMIISDDNTSNDYIGKRGTATQTMTLNVEDLYFGNRLEVSSLQYYSDIAPVTKNAILNYKYYNRFGDERTYTKVVELTDDYLQEHPDYFITDDLIYDNAPAVEDLHKDCTWTITEQKVTRQGTTATLWGTHSELMHTVYYRTSDNVGFAFKNVKDNDYLLDGSDEFFVANSKSADGDTNFAYWIVYDLNEHDKGINKEIAKCYSTKFNLRILGDYYIYPVYSNEKSQSLTISDPTFTREQYTDSTGEVKSDYLYADFIVAYMSSNGILLNGELAKDKYHTGLIVEFSNNHKIEKPDAVDAKLTADEFSALKTAYTAEESFSKSEIQTFATSDNKSGSVTTDESKSKAMYKFDIKNEDYNNKNRLDYYVKFPNTAYYRHYVYKAYYYVYYTNDNGDVVYDMTEPVYFTLFDIGNSSAVTTKTTE